MQEELKVLQIFTNLENLDTEIHLMRNASSGYSGGSWYVSFQKVQDGTKIEISKSGKNMVELLKEAYARFERLAYRGLPKEMLTPQLEAPKAKPPEDDIPF
jgi:hypothetical protein